MIWQMLVSTLLEIWENVSFSDVRFDAAWLNNFFVFCFDFIKYKAG